MMQEGFARRSFLNDCIHFLVAIPLEVGHVDLGAPLRSGRSAQQRGSLPGANIAAGGVVTKEK